MPPRSMDLATTLKLSPHPELFFVVRLIDLQRDSLKIRWRRDILDALPDILKLPHRLSQRPTNITTSDPYTLARSQDGSILQTSSVMHS